MGQGAHVQQSRWAPQVLHRSEQTVCLTSIHLMECCASSFIPNHKACRLAPRLHIASLAFLHHFQSTSAACFSLSRLQGSAPRSTI